ncbi:MAG: 6-phosphogluconolactonase [Desulfovermiculus sp.]
MALASSVAWVAPVLNAPKPPAERITLTLTVLNNAREIIFVATGTKKASALRAIFNDQYHNQPLPAALVDPLQGHLKWFVDEAAATQVMMEET